jgi:predicted nucleic acid-binding protein
MAEATGEITEEARKALDDVRRKKVHGVIHPLIAYEFLVQYHRKRLPAFDSAREALEFLNTYFGTESLTNDTASAASEIKVKSLTIVERMKRHLSSCDALTIALAKMKGYRILSGDQDLTLVAQKEEVAVTW